jgi:hypothetical protein
MTKHLSALSRNADVSLAEADACPKTELHLFVRLSINAEHKEVEHQESC